MRKLYLIAAVSSFAVLSACDPGPADVSPVQPEAVCGTPGPEGTCEELVEEIKEPRLNDDGSQP